MGSVGAASLCKSPRADKRAIVIRKVFQIVLCLAAGAYGVVGVLTITGALGGSREADSLSRAYIVFGSLFLMIGVMAAVATLFANKWRGWLIVAALILSLGLPLGLFAAFWIDMEKGEVHRRQMEEEVRSGKWDFGVTIRRSNWSLAYYPSDHRTPHDLLLDRAADINSTMPKSESEFASYTLLLYRTEMRPRYSDAYADALHLLERRADPNRVAG